MNLIANKYLEINDNLIVSVHIRNNFSKSLVKYTQSLSPFPSLNTICQQGEPRYLSRFSLLPDALVLVSCTTAIRQELLGALKSTIHTMSPTCFSLCCFWRRAKCSRTQRCQKKLAMFFSVAYRWLNLRLFHSCMDLVSSRSASIMLSNCQSESS